MFVFRMFPVVLLAIALLLPMSVGAESDGPHTVFIPLAMTADTEGPEMVQFRSCNGVFSLVDVGSVSAATEECLGERTYPDLVVPSEGMVLGGFWVAEYDWHIAPHWGEFDGVDQQYKVTFGPGGANVKYLTIAYRNGQITVTRGDEIFTEDTIVDGWNLTFHLEAEKPYVELQQGDTTIWTVLDQKFFWIEILTPVNSEDWGAWAEATRNGGQLPTAEELEATYVIARYQMTD